MKAILLCAGYGTRLLPLTENQPKALLPVKGKPILNYIIEKIQNVKEISQIYVISNDKFYTSFAWWLTKNQKNFSKPINIVNTGSITIEDQKGGINDTLLAINENNLDDDLLIIFGDNLFSFNISKLIDFFKQKQSNCLACYQLQNIKDAKKFGIIDLDENNKIIDIEEKPQEPKTDLLVTGIYIIKRQDIEKLRKFYEDSKEKSKLNPSHSITHFFQDLYKKQDVFALPFSGEWCDIGNLEDYEKVK
jgi:glucose-1-phosphate thymidylyltransferase